VAAQSGYRNRFEPPGPGGFDQRQRDKEKTMLETGPGTLATLLTQVKTIAVVGAKDAPTQPVNGVGRFLIEAGYTVYPVHPKRTDVWGLPTYPSLADVPGPIDLVDLFRAPSHCPGHAQEVLALPTLPKLFWMQLGITSPEAKAILADTPITVVEDLCLMVFLQQHGLTADGSGLA
jgi:hypothetical protein